MNLQNSSGKATPIKEENIIAEKVNCRGSSRSPSKLNISSKITSYKIAGMQAREPKIKHWIKSFLGSGSHLSA